MSRPAWSRVADMGALRTSRLASTTVADAMHPGVHSCSADATLSEVAEIMAERHVHAVVVADGQVDTRHVGMISDLDLIAAATVRDLDAQVAGGSAGSRVLTVAPSDSLEHAAQLMTRHGTAHLLVVDPGDDRPRGVISTLDIVNALVDV